jgi:imidazolonepropionase-like amidohydrolase
MRLDPLFDSLYVLSSLWGSLPGAQVCPVRPLTLPRTTLEAAGAAARKAPAPATAFVNVNVVPMDRERVLANQTVLVEGGRITALGPSSTIKVPAGAVRIDGRGKYLIPGLTDMHVHNDYGGVDYDKLAPSLFIFLADGVTAIRYLNHVSGDPQAFEAAGVLTPRVYARGFATYGAWGGMPARDSILGTDNKSEVRSSQNPNVELEKPDSMAAYVAAAKAAGYDFLRLNPSEVHARHALPAIDSLLAAAGRLGLRLATHSHEDSFMQTLALGAYGGSSDHLRSFWDTLGLSSRYGVQDTLGREEVDRALFKVPAFAAAVKRAGVWITPTLDCIEDKYSPPRTKLMILRQMVRALQDAGAGLLLSGDDGKNVHHELAALVRAGLTPYQALATGTRNPAQYFGLLDSIGTVAVDKRADLVLLNGNPLRDIRHTREPAGVMLGGRWLDRAELDQRLLALPMAKSWPTFWLRLGGVIPGLGRILAPGGVDPTQEQRQTLAAPVQTFEALTDSLAVAKSSGRDGRSASQRLRQLQAKELGAMRALLTPKQQVAFDPKVRIWLREQARQGHPATVPGVMAVP